MAETERFRLTDSAIARLRPREREYTVWDTRVAGLGVRVRPAGKASFILLRKVGGRSRRVSLGPATSRSVEDVRRHCHEVLAESAPDKPTGASRNAPLFRDFVAGPWRESHFSRYKAWTKRGVRSSLSCQLLPAFGETPLDEITRDQVLRWSEVDGDKLALGDSKTGPRTVCLNAQARRIIERQPRAESAFVFASPRDSNRPRGPHITLWDSVRREAGIEDVRMHDLRHTFASHAVMNGVPVPVVSRLLGHSDVRMTLRYAHLADREIESAAERIGTAMARVMSGGQRRPRS